MTDKSQAIVNLYITVGERGARRIAGKALIHKGRKP